MTQARIVQITVNEVDPENNNMIRVYLHRGLQLDQREDGELWAYMVDEYGFRFVYSLPLRSPRYEDGYLDTLSKRGWHDWVACWGNNCHKLVVDAGTMQHALVELDLVTSNEVYPTEDPDKSQIEKVDVENVSGEYEEESAPETYN